MARTDKVDDRLIGRAVALARGSTPQAALAEKMRARGWRWSQATVWSVEKGERPLRLAEARDLAGLLGVDLHRLFEDPDDTKHIRALDEARQKVRSAYGATAGQVQRLHEALRELRSAISKAERSTEPGVAEAVKAASDDLKLTPERALERGSRELRFDDYAREHFAADQAERGGDPIAWEEAALGMDFDEDGE